MIETLTANPAAAQVRHFDFSRSPLKEVFEEIDNFEEKPRDEALEKAAEYGKKKKLLCMWVSYGKQPSGARSALNLSGAKKTSTSLGATPSYLRLVSVEHPEIKLHPEHPQVVGMYGEYYGVRNHAVS